MINRSEFEKWLRPDFELHGGDIRLIPLTEAWASERYAAWFTDPEVTEQTRHGSRHLSIDDLKKYIVEVRVSGRTSAFAIMAGGEHVGNISLNDVDWSAGSGEISVLIGEKIAWGRGVATAAVVLVRDWALNTILLRRVWMGTPVSNVGMVRVAEKCGFVREGTLRSAFVKRGEPRDLAQFSIVGPAETNSSRARFTVLMKYGNAVGLEYLKALRAEGLVPDGVIFKGDSFDQKDKRILEERTEGKYKPLFSGDVLNDLGWPFFFVQDHNALECEAILARLRPDALLLAGCDIIRANILEKTRYGALNCHPGKIPFYRGCSNVEWSIFNDDEVGASVHLCTTKIDHGPVIHWEPMPVYRSDKYSDVRARMVGHQTRVMIEGARKFLVKPTGWITPEAKGRYYPVMGPAELTQVVSKIDRGAYRHMSEAGHVL